MAHTPFRPWHGLVLVAAFLGAALVSKGAPPTVVSQILSISSDSLTSDMEDAKTSVQDVQPRVEQRGVGLDGGLRAGAPFGMAIAGNPFGVAWTGSLSQNGVRLDTGSWSPWQVDIALPSPGFSWTVGRNYSAVQEYSSAEFVSDGPQGKNWFQISQPEIDYFEHATDASKDFVYLVYGADRYVEYQRYDASSDEFRGKNGAAGVFLYEQEEGEGEPDTYTLTDQRGTEFVFFGFNGDASTAAGQLWKITDADGNVAYVGDDTTGSTAISSGYDGGRILFAYDTADRRFSYTYTTLDGTKRLTEVKAETKTGGTWASPTGQATAAEVDYAYYSNETYGDAGGLKKVTITTPLSDSGVSSTRKQYFRYWEGAFNASTNPGHPHSLKYVMDFEGTRNYDWQDFNLNESFASGSNESIKAYASAYFEYDSTKRIVEAWFNGACGCSGAGTGTQEYEYETNASYSDGSGYDTAWARRTVVKLPNGSYLTQYFDEAGQGLHRVATDADPDNTGPAPNRWITKVVRDGSGRVTNVHTPSNITGYTHAEGSFALTTSTSAGLAYVYTYISSGDMTGFIEHKKFEEGTSGSEYLLETLAYSSLTKTIDVDLAVARPLVSSKRVYPAAITSGTTDSTVNSLAYTSYSGTLMPETETTTWNAVSSGNNGSGSSDTSKRHFNEDGVLDFEKSRGGSITYREYTSGQLTKLIKDADTTKTASGEDFENIDIPTGFASSGSPLHQVTEYGSDAQGRRATATLPGGRVTKVYYSRLADERLTTLNYTKYETSPWTIVSGPVGYTVRNHAGKTETQGTVALAGNQSMTALTSHIDETDSDPILAIASLGSMCRMRTNHFDEPGTRMEETRVYFDIPASGAGTDGTNYDPTLFAYDDSGHKWRTKEASGTIRRTVFDALGRMEERWLGTNDSSFSGGESSGTDNMVKVEEVEYDSDGDDGNSHLTERTLHLDDSGSSTRVWGFDHDVRGKVLLSTNPTAPHAFHKFDNLSRRVATGQFSSTTNIVVGTDDPTTETSNRLALSETAYDELGRVWKTTRHKIDVDDGSTDDTLLAEHWFNAEGETIKTDGSSLVKTFYDGLGRTTHRFILAVDNDTAYTDADDVTGDAVLAENQTTYDSSTGNVIMRARIDRLHDDKGPGHTTGPLNTNADTDDLKYTAANLEGRIQITGLWYDSLDRLADTVRFGTYGGSDFDRDGMSVPSRSDTALRTTNSYATDGTVQDVTDPKALVQRTEYDDAGRVIKTIQNYGDGTPSGADSDVTVKYDYTDGLRTKLTADLPAGSTDQETLYIYGTTTGTPSASEISTGHLLRAAVYPDSTNNGTTEANINSDDSDVVSFCYNAQGEEIYKKDQAGNVIERDFDASGRLTQRRVTSLAAGFDGDIRRIMTTIDSLGRREKVTQYDNSTVGSGTIQDEACFTRDDWGNISMFEEDRNSAVSSGNDEYTISYTWEKATGGRNTLRRNTMTLPSGAVIDYNYSTAPTYLDDDASRVTYLEHGATVVASYLYNGVRQLVQSDYNEIEVMWQKFGSTSGSYPDLDRFNRVTTSRWTTDLGTDIDFYDVDITYDRNSNITLVEDQIQTGFDVSFTMDNVDRLTQAEEGIWGGSSITTTSRDEQWTLDQLGNWDVNKLDLNGDGDWGDTGELNDDRTHNDVNELTARDTDDNGTNNYTLVYDAAGNMTDDGENYKFVWDAFGRLREVKDQSDDLVAEHRYNGLGHRIGEHVDTDSDGDVDANDNWRYFAHDERWRVAARFGNAQTNPRQEFLYHAAGLSGYGGSSYIDDLILRERDVNADGTADSRLYYCQNWRADLAVLVDDNGEIFELGKFSSYGAPFGLPGADTNSDGDCDAADVAQIAIWVKASQYNVIADVDLDGDTDATDESTAQSRLQGTTLGRGALSAVSIANRNGYAGYTWVPTNEAYFVRHRVHSPGLGRWLSRDPLALSVGAGILESLPGEGMATGRLESQPMSDRSLEVTVALYEVCSGRGLGCVDPSGLWGKSVARRRVPCDSRPVEFPLRFTLDGIIGLALVGSGEDACQNALKRVNIRAKRQMRKEAPGCLFCPTHHVPCMRYLELNGGDDIDTTVKGCGTWGTWEHSEDPNYEACIAWCTDSILKYTVTCKCPHRAGRRQVPGQGGADGF